MGFLKDMLTQWARLGIKKPTHSEWQETWDARQKALERVLGPPDDRLFHSPVPLASGGNADVLGFSECLPGAIVYCTADLTGDASALPITPDGIGFELVVCCRTDDEAMKRMAPEILSRLAPHTLKTAVSVGHTMDIGEVPNTGVRGLAFTDWPSPTAPFEFNGEQYRPLLCIGLTEQELAFGIESGGRPLLLRLCAAGIDQITTSRRESCV